MKKMKKAAALMMTVAMMLSMAACGHSKHTAYTGCRHNSKDTNNCYKLNKMAESRTKTG